jgi:hypothetical protein
MVASAGATIVAELDKSRAQEFVIPAKAESRISRRKAMFHPGLTGAAFLSREGHPETKLERSG